MTFPPYYIGETIVAFAGKILWQASPSVIQRFRPWGGGRPVLSQRFLALLRSPVVRISNDEAGRINASLRKAGIRWHVANVGKGLYSLVPDGQRVGEGMGRRRASESLVDKENERSAPWDVQRGPNFTYLIDSTGARIGSLWGSAARRSKIEAMLRQAGLLAAKETEKAA